MFVPFYRLLLRATELFLLRKMIKKELRFGHFFFEKTSILRVMLTFFEITNYFLKQESAITSRPSNVEIEFTSSSATALPTGVDTSAGIPGRVADSERATELARNITQKMHRIQKNIVELKQVR